MIYLDFVKMHGLLNSFILLSDFSDHLPSHLSRYLAQQSCSSHEGIGADGLVILRASSDKKADLEMDFYNSDGTQAEMCGNAVRCSAKYAVDLGLSSNSQIVFKTPAGYIKTSILENSNQDAVVLADMGIPVFDPLKKYPQGFNFRNRDFIPISMGNPHAVTFVNDWNFDYQELGGALQKEDFFPQGVNVEFARLIEDGKIEVRVIERGVGETYACGTGACAVTAAYLRGMKTAGQKQAQVQLLGGTLTIKWEGGNTSMEMIGPVKKIATGTYMFESTDDR